MNRIILIRHFLLNILIISLSGCQSVAVSNLNDLNKKLDMPKNWPSKKHEPSDFLPTDMWWERFEDPQINKLVESVLDKNSELSSAFYNLKSVYLNAELTNTNLTPDVSASIGGSTSRQLNHSMPSSRSYSSNFSLNYELDLWGKLSVTRELSQWEAAATESDYLALKLKLIGSALDLYWKNNYIDERLNLLMKNSEYVNYLMNLSEKKFELGSGSKLEVLQSKQVLYNNEEQLRYILNQKNENTRALSILLNQAPSSSLPFTFLNSEPNDIKPLEIPLPVTLLSRRPDLQAAEKRLITSSLNIDLAKSSYYPSLTLSTSLSTGGSRDFLKLLKDPIGTIGSTLTFPFIHFNQARLKTKIAKLQYQKDVASFQKAFYDALKEVEDILELRDLYYSESLALNKTLIDVTQMLAINEAAWKVGSASLKDVLEQRQSLLNVYQQLAENKYNLFLIEMKLYLAIGGGVS